MKEDRLLIINGSQRETEQEHSFQWPNLLQMYRDELNNATKETPFVRSCWNFELSGWLAHQRDNQNVESALILCQGL